MRLALSIVRLWPLSFLALTLLSPAHAYPGMPVKRVGAPAASAFCEAAAKQQAALPDLKKRLIHPQWQLGLDLLNAHPQDQPVLAVSPASVHEALTLAAVGARGATLKGLTQLLGGAADDADWLGLARLGKAQWTCRKPFWQTELLAANALFSAKEVPPTPAYSQTLRQNFDAVMRPLDFKEASAAARSEINSWVATSTQDRIKDLLSADAVRPSTMLVLVNALFVKAGFKKEFDAKLTSNRPFHAASGKTSSVPSMRALGGAYDFSYYRGAGFQLVGLPTKDQVFELLIILPDAGQALPEFLAKLKVPVLDRALTEAKGRPVHLWLPKFNFASSLSLRDTLANTAAKPAFVAGQADFSGISQAGKGFFIDAVLHRSVISVDEFGFEASAATALTMMPTAAGEPPPPPVELIVDRPFAFAVVHRETATPLFLGRVLAL